MGNISVIIKLVLILNLINSYFALFCYNTAENDYKLIKANNPFQIKTNPENTVNTYIHNNLTKIRNDNIFLSWFCLEKFNQNSYIMAKLKIKFIFHDSNNTYFNIFTT